jgi:hypothetical protein
MIFNMSISYFHKISFNDETDLRVRYCSLQRIGLGFRMPVAQCSFWVNFVCCHTGDHPQGDLATFGYIPVMTVKKY